MAKERKTASELEEIIIQRVAASGLLICVHPDTRYGWCTEIIKTPPEQFVATQEEVERITRDLRMLYDLRTTAPQTMR